MISSSIGFTLQGRTESREFWVRIILGQMPFIQFLLSSSTSKRFKNTLKTMKMDKRLKFISQSFLETKQQALSYFIYIAMDPLNLQSLTLDNGQRKEKLVIKEIDGCFVLISRHP